MFGKVLEFLKWRAALLMQGRCEDFARSYQYPMALYLDQNWLPITNLDAGTQHARELLSQHQAAGVVSTVVTLSAISIPRGNTFRTWVTYSNFDAMGRQIRQSSAIHYLKMTKQGFVIEMSEYRHCALSEPLDLDDAEPTDAVANERY